MKSLLVVLALLVSTSAALANHHYRPPSPPVHPPAHPPPTQHRPPVINRPPVAPQQQQQIIQQRQMQMRASQRSSAAAASFKSIDDKVGDWGDFANLSESELAVLFGEMGLGDAPFDSSSIKAMLLSQMAGSGAPPDVLQQLSGQLDAMVGMLSSTIGAGIASYPTDMAREFKQIYAANCCGKAQFIAALGAAETKLANAFIADFKQGMVGLARQGGAPGSAVAAFQAGTLGGSTTIIFDAGDPEVIAAAAMVANGRGGRTNVATNTNPGGNTPPGGSSNQSPPLNPGGNTNPGGNPSPGGNTNPGGSSNPPPLPTGSVPPTNPTGSTPTVPTTPTTPGTPTTPATPTTPTTPTTPPPAGLPSGSVPPTPPTGNPPPPLPTNTVPTPPTPPGQQVVSNPGNPPPPMQLSTLVPPPSDPDPVMIVPGGNPPPPPSDPLDPSGLLELTPDPVPLPGDGGGGLPDPTNTDPVDPSNPTNPDQIKIDPPIEEAPPPPCMTAECIQRDLDELKIEREVLEFERKIEPFIQTLDTLGNIGTAVGGVGCATLNPACAALPIGVAFKVLKVLVTGGKDAKIAGIEGADQYGRLGTFVGSSAEGAAIEVVKEGLGVGVSKVAGGIVGGEAMETFGGAVFDAGTGAVIDAGGDALEGELRLNELPTDVGRVYTGGGF